MTIINLSSGSESSWIESTYPFHAADDVGRYPTFVVEFSRTVALTSLISSNFGIIDSNGEEVTDAFKEIDITSDYDEINKILKLRLTAALEPDSEYAFVIKDLLDPTGTPMDQDHFVMFVTNSLAVTLDPTSDAGPITTAKDYTIGAISYVPVDEPVEEGLPTVIRTIPTTGSYNLKSNWNSGLLGAIFDTDLAGSGVITCYVEKRPITPVETNWDTVPVEVTVDTNNVRLVNVQLPEVTTGVYLEDAYEYRMLVGYGAEVSELVTDDGRAVYFTGPLTPMLASVKDVLFYFPNVSPIDIAKEIYLNSYYTMEMVPTMDPTFPTKSASDYVLYSVLFQHSVQTSSGSAEGFTLGDLSVTSSATTGAYDFSDRFHTLMNEALSKLVRVTPQVVVKGGAITSPFATRNWRNV